ncbi:MAG: PPC domain-containing protein [Chloroflexi bacterium]|nr:PPC domain-containing protein [Chloroflexota bacterium]
MRLACLCLILLLQLLLIPAGGAQSREIDSDQARIEHDGLISGRLDGGNPRDVYYVDGLRGEVIRFELNATDGDLDPVLGVFDDSGRLALWRDDSDGATGVYRDLTMERTGRYFVVVGRFGYSLGTTAGTYDLRMTRKGVLSERGSTLRYGDSVIGTISNTSAEVYYTFQAQQGDILTISMVRSSGTLDPFLRVVDGDRFVIAENDDQHGETRNARIDGLIIERGGTYIVMATRYDDSSGSFVLSIEEAENSGTGSTRLAPLPIGYSESRISTLNHEQFERFYAFHASADDLITIDMERGGSGDLDSYLILSDGDFKPLAEDDDSGEGQNSRIIDFRIPSDGKYHIIATRYDGGAGTTIGEFKLSLEILDDPLVEVPPGTVSLEFGTSVTGAISEENQGDVYAFYGRQGEVVSISMTRVDGNLDALLELLNGAQEILTRNDDRAANDQNALIDHFALPATGTYYIRARRYAGTDDDPNTTGSYVLILAERAS